MKEVNLILSDLKKKNYRPVYFLTGEEPYFIDLISDYIESNVLDEAEKEFNQSVLYGKDITCLDIVSEAKRYPLMSDHLVVIVKEAQNIRDIEKLDSYISQPAPNTILVICYKYKTLDKRTSFAKKVDKNALLLDSKKLYDNQIPDWIINFLKEKNYRADEKALVLLTEYLGSNLSKIANELNKLMINLPIGGQITTDHIEKFIGISKDYNVFELQSALGKKDVMKANKIINYFAANTKENPLVVIIGTLFSYFSKILTFHYLENKNDQKAVASALKVNPFFVKDYMVAARNFDIRKTVEIVSILREYDAKSKGVENVSASEGDLMKEMIFKILH
jgi:DNA polymerase III subunit delta